MNDITPPGRLPRPNQKLVVPPRSVRSVPAPSAAPPQPKESAPNAPLDLPGVAPERLVVPRKKRRWVKWLLIVFALLLVAAAAAVFAGYSWYQDALKPRSSSTESVHVMVAAGATAESVATELEQKGVIKSAFALQIYMKLNGKGNIKAGSYLFSPNQPPSEIVQWLDEGKVDTFKVTILPGQTLAEIKKALLKYNYTSEAIDAAFAKQYTNAIFVDKPAGTSLEGYIFPDTYFVTSDITVEQLLQTTFAELEEKVNELNLVPALKQRNFTLYQGLTLASIIEKEVTGDSDQRQVSQVFQTRLSLGMALGSDVTYHYAAELLGVEPSPDINSPYNTRKVTGLPPGPISNFPIKTLLAVANPASGDYLFFVAGDDGVTHFAHTDQEHQANVQKYCQKLCSTF